MNEDGRSKRRRASSKPLRYQHDESEDEKSPPTKSPPPASAVKKNGTKRQKTKQNKGTPSATTSKKQPSTNDAKDVGEEETPSKKPRIKIRLSVKGGKGGGTAGSSSPTPTRGKRKAMPEPQDDNNGKKKAGGGKRKIEPEEKVASKSSSREIKVRVKVNNKACREGVAIAVKDEPVTTKKKKAAPKKKVKEEETSGAKSSSKEIKVRVKVDNKTCKEGVAIAVKDQPVKKKKKTASTTNKKVNSSSERQKFIRKWNRLSTQTELMKACEEINVACGRATVEQLHKRLMKWLDGTYPEPQEEIKVRVKVNNKTCSEGVTVAIKGGGKKKKSVGKKGKLKKEEDSDNSDVDEIDEDDEDDMDVKEENEGGDDEDEEMEEVDLPQDNIFEGGAPDISAAKLKFPYRLCKVPTCNKYKKSRSDGYCRIHYQEFGPKSDAKKKGNEDEQSEEEEVEDSKPAAKKTEVPQDVPQEEDSAEQPQDPKTSAENATEGSSAAKGTSTDNSKEAAAATPSVRPSNYVQVTAAFKCSDVVDAVLKSKKSFKKLRNGSRDYIKELAGKEDIKFGNQYWQSIRSLLHDAIDASKNGEEINHASLLRLYTSSNNMAPLSAEDRLTLRSPRSPKKDAPKVQASSLEEEDDIDDGVTKVRVRLSSKLQQGFCQAILPAELREKWEMVAERPKKKKSEETTNKKVSGESKKNEGPTKPENAGGAKLSYYMKQAYGQIGEIDGDDDEYETETIVKELYQCPKCDKTNLTKNGMHAHWGMKHSNYDSKSAKKSGDNGVKCDLSLCKVVGKTTVVVRKKKNNNGNKKVKKRKSTDGALPSLGLPKIGDDAAMKGDESTPHITVSPSRPAWPPQNLKASSRIDPSQLDFEVNLNPIKKTNGSLKCLAVGCEKNQQGSAKFCRTHHNQYLICMGLCGSWECKCGSKIADFQDRCGKCHRWRDGKHPGNGNADPNKSRKVRNSLEVISKRGMEVAELPTVQESTAAVVPLPQAQLDTIAAMSASQQKQVAPAAASFGGIPSEISVSQGTAAEVVAPPPPELPINRNYKVTVKTDNGVEEVPISYPPDNLNYYGSIHPALGYPYISLHYDFNLSYYQNNTYDYLVSGLGRDASSKEGGKEDGSSDDDDDKEGAASSADDSEEKKVDDDNDEDSSRSEVDSKQSV